MVWSFPKPINSRQRRRHAAQVPTACWTIMSSATLAGNWVAAPVEGVATAVGAMAAVGAMVAAKAMGVGVAVAGDGGGTRA